MAKELPYFKFETSAWDTGKIQMCTPEVRAVFIDLCSMYWQRLGDLPYKLALQKVCGGNASALDSLYDEDVIKIKDGQICIDFLNEQLHEFDNVSTQNSKNAREGWEKRRKDAFALRPQSERNAIREEKRREEEKREEELNLWPSFDDFWDKYDKKNDRDKCEKKWKKITHGAREKIMSHLELYIPSTPDKTYRKNPYTYLNNNSWENEVIFKIENNGKRNNGITAQGTLDRLNRYAND